ncbi:MAG: Uma2 family endonuclease [Chloroflexi bacterium]|nr:Uma2 family endonuclease [Chloroflexota bacterium]
MVVATRVKLNYADLQLFPNDGKRHELIDGEHIMTPAPETKHQDTVGNLFALFRGFVRQNKLGRVFVAPVDVVFSEYDVIEPDIVFVSANRKQIITKTNIRGAPDLVVEILSPSTKEIDRKTKFKLYEKYGVREYWIIDPDAETIEIYALRAEGYVLFQKFSRGDSVRSDVLSGFACMVDELFEV